MVGKIWHQCGNNINNNRKDNDNNSNFHRSDDNNTDSTYDKWVINMSKSPLTEMQWSHPARGPKFAVVPKYPPKVDYIAVVEEVCHCLCPKVAAELSSSTKHKPPRPNITLQETRAIKELKTHQSRIIITADKGVAMVVMD